MWFVVAGFQPCAASDLTLASRAQLWGGLLNSKDCFLACDPPIPEVLWTTSQELTKHELKKTKSHILSFSNLCVWNFFLKDSTPSLEKFRYRSTGHKNTAPTSHNATVCHSRIVINKKMMTLEDINNLDIVLILTELKLHFRLAWNPPLNLNPWNSKISNDISIEFPL